MWDDCETSGSFGGGPRRSWLKPCPSPRNFSRKFFLLLPRCADGRTHAQHENWVRSVQALLARSSRCEHFPRLTLASFCASDSPPMSSLRNPIGFVLRNPILFRTPPPLVTTRMGSFQP